MELGEHYLSPLWSQALASGDALLDYVDGASARVSSGLVVARLPSEWLMQFDSGLMCRSSGTDTQDGRKRGSLSALQCSEPSKKPRIGLRLPPPTSTAMERPKIGPAAVQCIDRQTLIMPKIQPEH